MTVAMTFILHYNVPTFQLVPSPHATVTFKVDLRQIGLSVFKVDRALPHSRTQTL